MNTTRLPSIAATALTALTAALAACDGTMVVGGADPAGSGAGSPVGASSSAAGTGGGDVTSSSATGPGGSQPLDSVDKLDLLLEVDNSLSMADKQEVLVIALADLVVALVNPPCLDLSGAPAPSQPDTGDAACPSGTERAYQPLRDIHIGILTSSLGGHGSDSCVEGKPALSCPGGSNTINNTINDKGHFIARPAACATGDVETYQNKGFLAWAPGALPSSSAETSASTLTTKIETMVLGAGQIGCGFESQLESWYHFLVDPEPYTTVTVDPTQGIAVLQGIDTALLAQRTAFLRPDSLLAILLLTDENDCSVRDGGVSFYALQQHLLKNPNASAFLPRARQECATNPADPCCRSCSADQKGCPADALCAEKPSLNYLEDALNLRCFDQKRRFGFDFLYPVDRYVQGLTSPVVPNRAGEMVPNPIFSDLDPTDNNTTVRDPSLVVFAGIVGVPWQDIARDPADLTQGLLSGDELSQKVNGVSRWDIILGAPADNIAPQDPFMRESVDPRSGTNPVTGAPIVLPGSASKNPINGNEYTIPDRADLQYACTYPLLQPRQCLPGDLDCDCFGGTNDNPLCDPQNATTQLGAKAYPGLRELDLLKRLGPQGITSSICPAQLTDPTRADFAYRPAFKALLERITPRFKR